MGFFVSGMGVARHNFRALPELLGLTGLAVLIDASYFFLMFRAFGIDVDPLMIAGGAGESIDLGLVDVDPAADADFLADMVEQIVGMGKIHKIPAPFDGVLRRLHHSSLIQVKTVHTLIETVR